MMTQTTFWLFFSFVGVSFGVLLLIYWMLNHFGYQRRVARIVRQHKGDQQEESRLESILSPLSSLVEKRDVSLPQRLHLAGIENSNAAAWFAPLKYSALLLGELLIAMLVFTLDIATNYWIALAAAWAMAVILLPDMWLEVRKTNRQRRISRSLPYLIDLMAICVQTGMSIEASLKYLAIEIQSFNPELGKLLDNTNQRARIVGMERALQELYQQVPSSEMRSFMLTLTQSMQHGSSIYTMLTTLSGDIREVQMLELEEQIGKLAAKMSIPLIVFILIPLVFVITAPGVMRMMSHV